MKNKNVDKLIRIIVFILIIITIGLFFYDIHTERSNDRFYDLTDIFNINNKEEELHISFDIMDTGYDIYTCNGYGYRYGPSIIKNEDGSLDLWISSPGNNSTEWDYIRYMHSEDGINWSREEIVLRPTKNSLDHYSVCDPGVIYFNGYYYLGYTSTTNSLGYNNSIFVARSENPDGPFEKWNGEGWGGNPMPIIEFSESEAYWGTGEISFCIKDDKLYCYYTWIGSNGNETRVSTADLVDDWPSTLKYRGVAIYKDAAEDSSDVVYLKEYDRFLAISVEERMGADSSIAVYESVDGYSFEKVDELDEDIMSYCHNIGISKSLDGSINLDDSLYIGYGYGDDGWGKWSARIQPISLVSKFS